MKEADAVIAAIEALQGDAVAASKILEMYYELMILRKHNAKLQKVIDDLEKMEGISYKDFIKELTDNLK